MNRSMMMKQTQSTFQSSARVPQVSTDKVSTVDDSLTGLSCLPKYKLEKVHKEKNLSPRSVKKRVDTFLEEKILGSKEATAVMFEELSK